MTKLTETQTIVLRAGAQRPENIALLLLKGLAVAAAKMAVSKMTERGWLQEVDANLRRSEPLWRETGDGHGTTLVPFSQATSWLTRWRRVSRRPWSASVVSKTGRAWASGL